jgi:hypothetical protein
MYMKNLSSGQIYKPLHVVKLLSLSHSKMNLPSTSSLVINAFVRLKLFCIFSAGVNAVFLAYTR